MKAISIIIVTSLVFFGFSKTGGPETDKQLIDEDMPYLLAFYKDRHQHPEISLQEKQTSMRLAEELRKLGIAVTENFGGYGIVGVLKNGSGPTILYRTDMDALPMYEKTELPYQSVLTTDLNGAEVGTMHSCGHDVHMTTWLGTARAMAKMKDKWKGTLLLIGQPAEEIGAGSKLMLNNGLYEKFGVPNYGIGLHASPTLEAGKVGFGKGYTMANSESITINVFGVGAHGASPHMSIDPVVIASMLVMELQTIVSRNVDPLESVVVSVGVIQGGTASNIIPDKVTLRLTVRTFTQEMRNLVHKRIKEIARGVAISAGLSEDKMPEVIIPETYTPANFNNPALVDQMMGSAAAAIGKENVVDYKPVLLGEDFARYGHTKENVPCVLFWLGTITEEKIAAGNLPSLHSPYYFPAPEKTIETGVTVVTQALLDLFNTKI